VGRYVDGIVPALVGAGVDLIVVAQPRDRAMFEQTGARVVDAPPSAQRTAGRLVWEQIGLPRLAKRLHASVVHSPHYTFPLLSRRKRVVTVHDLTFYSHPELHSAAKRWFFRFWLRLGALVRIPVVAVSEATGREYRNRFHRRGNVTVAPLGFEEALFHPPSADEVADFRLHAPQPERSWIAFLGTLEPRKNVVALIEAYRLAVASLEPERRPSLLLAGAAGWDPHVEPAVLAAQADGHDVRLLGYLPVNLLAAFLGGATVVAYPSLGEGFGLPVLEAMASGGVVLTSDQLSLPEVGGDAVAYTGTGPEQIASALSELLLDDLRRQELRERARTRALGFSWPRTAERHVEAYRGVERRSQ
jgi:glycosyltransferase involved in cell wall biosynthesis